MLKEFFSANLDVVFLFYGFSFIVMAIAILIQPRRESSFKLSGTLTYLALFGLTHGINEWLDMFSLVTIKGHIHNSFLFNLVRLAVLAVSFIFLFEFGRRLILLRLKEFLNKWVTFVLCLITLIFMVVSKEDRSIWPRYFLGFPGGILSALGFIWYYYDNKGVLKDLGVSQYFVIATFSVEIYAVLSGFVVPAGDFFPAYLINNNTFLNLVGIPVQVFRMLCAGILSYAIWNILGIFNWEMKTKLEDSLKETTAVRENLDNIIRSMADSLIIVGEDLKIVLANSAALELLDYKKENLFGLSIKEILVEEKSVFEGLRFKKLIKEGSISNYEAIYKARKGNLISVAVSISLVKNKDSDFNNFSIIARDITERKFSEDALRDSEEKYRTMIEYSNDLIWTLDLAGNFTYFNKKAEEVSGYRYSDWAGRSFQPMLLTEDLERMEKIMLEVLSGKAQHYEISVMRADGSIFVLSVNSAPLFKGGKINGTVSFGQDITEYKKVQEKIEAEYKFRHAIENSINAGISVVNLVGREIYVNPAFCEMTGWSEKELLGQTPPFKYWPPEELEKINKTYQDILYGNLKNNSFELRFCRRNEERFDVLLLVSPLEDGKGNNTGWLALIYDITERKRAEEKLRETNEYLESLINYANAPIIAWDTKFIITRFNRVFEILTGRNAPDVIGKSLEVLFSPDQVENSMKLIRKTLSGNRWESVEIDIVHLDGSVRTVLWNSANIYAPDGKTPVATVAQGYDISERKKAEELLKEAKEQAELLYEVVPSAIFTVDRARRITGWNKKAEQITGYTAEEMIGKDCLVFSDFPCKEKCGLYSDDTSKPIVSKECSLIAKNGERHFVLKNADFIKDSNGNIIGGIESFEDITERKWAEEELKNAYNQLKLTQYQLIQAEKMDTVGRLASGVAHEVKNPLAIILQGVDFISKKVPHDNEDVALTLGYMNDAVVRANNIIKGLLDFSSTTEVNVSPEDLNHIMQSTLLLLKNSIEQNHVAISRDFSEEIPFINVDKNKVEQVFVNLILNSVQAMPSGGEIKIKTYLERQEDGEIWAVIEIEDSGPGIPEEIMDKVFDPFFTTKRGKGGTGLGLSVVMNIIDIHQGKIELGNRKDTHGLRTIVKFKA